MTGTPEPQSERNEDHDIEELAARVREGDRRALGREQVELLAGRVSAINECFY